MKWTIGTKIGTGFALALLALLLVGIVSYRSTNVLITSSQSVAHTHEVLERLRLLLATLRDGESGQRGYLITGEDPYLEPYTTAKARWISCSSNSRPSSPTIPTNWPRSRRSTR